jgi:hypothetical protein
MEEGRSIPLVGILLMNWIDKSINWKGEDKKS